MQRNSNHFSNIYKRVAMIIRRANIFYSAKHMHTGHIQDANYVDRKLNKKKKNR